MYTIYHLPSGSYYGLGGVDGKKLSVVCFREYKTAKYVSESIATHAYLHGRLPELCLELCLVKRGEKRRHSLESKLWVEKRYLTRKYLHDLGSRNIDVCVVNHLSWLDDVRYDVDMKYVHMEGSSRGYTMALESDLEVPLE